MAKLFIVLSSIVMIFLIDMSSVEAISFKDVPESYRFYEDIDFLSDKEIITGFPDGRFIPNDEVTRAQAAIMIGKMLELDGTKRKVKFSDVNSTNTASGYIDAASIKGIITGFPDGTFRPNQPVTRGQLAILLTRAFKLEGKVTTNFKDVSPSAVSYPYISKMIFAEITLGYPDNTYRPDESVNRGQFAAFLTRSFNSSLQVIEIK